MIKGITKEKSTEEIVAEEDAKDGIMCGYQQTVAAFNVLRNERFVNEKKMARKSAEKFPELRVSPIVVKNFIRRAKSRFINPPIKVEADGFGLFVKTRNISVKEIDHLSMPYLLWERMGSPKI
jgi:hypothetical protein